MYGDEGNERSTNIDFLHPHRVKQMSKKLVGVLLVVLWEETRMSLWLVRKELDNIVPTSPYCSYFFEMV